MDIRDARPTLAQLGITCVTLFTLAGCLGGSGGDQVDPRLGEAPVAYVLRAAPLDDDGVLLPRDEQAPLAFFPGGELVIRDAAAPSALERRLSARLFSEPHDVRDLSPSYDGRRLLFALRAPEIPGADEDDQPRWDIWEYQLDSDNLRRIISSDLIAGEGNDLMPRYLPDGRILFVSDRQRQSRARLLDEGKPQFAAQEESRQANALVLHVMNSDGSDIRQISFNPSHDLAPQVMADGRVLLVRWDNNGTRNAFNFYVMHPDGSRAGILYGADSHEPDDPAPRYTAPWWLEDGRVLVMKRPEESGSWSGVPQVIDVLNFINRTVPLAAVAGEAESAPLSLPLALEGDSEGNGRLAWVSPLGDGSGRLLAAWAPCRLRDPLTSRRFAGSDDNLGRATLVAAEPAYRLWIMDPRRDRQLPVRAPADGVMVTEAVALVARTRPPALADGVAGIDRDLALAERGAGVLNIRSVFDVDGVFQPPLPLPAGVTTLAQFADPAQVRAADRGALFVRISKAVLIPDRDLVMVDGDDIGRLPALGMREIVGYAPVSPDGSVRVEVPANVALDIELVAADGRRLGSRHGAWISVRPGEEYHCGGCHAAGSPASHGRPDAWPASVNAGAPVTGLPFPNTRPALFADAGETLAEVLTRVEPERLSPSLDLVFEDLWTDPALPGGPDPAFSLPYADLTTPAPVSDAACLVSWTPLCRSIIHYRDHVQPLWALPRDIVVDGMPVTQSCLDCHRRRDQVDMLQVPPAQLELTDDLAPEAASQLLSYRELLFPDNALALEDGALVDARQPLLDDNGQPLYQTDEDGNLVLDENDNPIPLFEPVPVTPPMVAGNARASRFFTVMTSGAHAGWMSAAELRLVAEWLDIGAQNYNDPFVVPQ